MKKAFSAKPFGWLLFLTVLATLIALHSYCERSRVLSESLKIPTSAPRNMAPEFQARLAMILTGQGTAAPTAEQIKEEEQVEREQVKTAIAWLNDTNPDQRIAGAQQLAAYPTTEAEIALAKALAKDRVPEVRAEAAQSLTSFDALQATTVKALLTALVDSDENVCRQALVVLQEVYDRLVQNGETKAARKLLKNLNTQSQSRRVSRPIRTEINDFLSDVNESD